MIDNDFGGDPDGLVQLAHHLLTKSIEIPGIIVSHLRKDDGWTAGSDGIESGVLLVNEVLQLTNCQIPVFKGASDPMQDSKKPIESAGVDFILSEVRKSDDLPLFIACGGSLTQIASAYLKAPDDFNNVTLVWIGGAEHEGIGIPTFDSPQLEYNTHEDVFAAQVIFNAPNLNFWQIPRNTYRQSLFSFSEIDMKLKGNGKLGDWLREKLIATNNRWFSQGRMLGETYCLGDSGLVLLTALHAPYEPDASSSSYIAIPAPNLNTDGSYSPNQNGREIRVYSQLDCRLMFEDLVSKITLLAEK